MNDQSGQHCPFSGRNICKPYLASGNFPHVAYLSMAKETLRHNNISKRAVFLLRTQSQTMIYDLQNVIWIKIKVGISILYSFKPSHRASNMNLQTIWMSRSDFGKKIVTKKLVPWNHSYLKYALDFNVFSEKANSWVRL